MKDLDNNLQKSTNKFLSYPNSITMHVNYWCNSKCSYCWMWTLPKRNTPLTDLKFAIEQSCDLGVSHIGLTGGEPLLHPDLPKLISFIRSKGASCSLLTNGLLLTPKRIRAILESGLNAMVVSLDTIDPDSYYTIRGVPIEPAIRSLEYLVDEKKNFPCLSIVISCVVSKINVLELETLIEYCTKREIIVGFQPIHTSFVGGNKPTNLVFNRSDKIIIQKVVQRIIQMKQDGYLIDNGDEYLDGFADFLCNGQLPADFACVTGFSSLAIDHELNVKSCWPMGSLGNLQKNNLRDIWISESFNIHRAKMLQLECPKCWLRCHTEDRLSLTDSIEWVLEKYGKQ